jgi:hypothetical protein
MIDEDVRPVVFKERQSKCYFNLPALFLLDIPTCFFPLQVDEWRARLRKIFPSPTLPSLLSLHFRLTGYREHSRQCDPLISRQRFRIRVEHRIVPSCTSAAAGYVLSARRKYEHKLQASSFVISTSLAFPKHTVWAVENGCRIVEYAIGPLRNCKLQLYHTLSSSNLTTSPPTNAGTLHPAFLRHLQRLLPPPPPLPRPTPLARNRNPSNRICHPRPSTLRRRSPPPQIRHSRPHRTQRPRVRRPASLARYLRPAARPRAEPQRPPRVSDPRSER